MTTTDRIVGEGGLSAIKFHYKGCVERWSKSKRRYVWLEGYSENGNTQPWLTYREAQREAARRGAKAVFVQEAT